MGIGFGLTEERILDRNQTGKMVNRNWHDLQDTHGYGCPAA